MHKFQRICFGLILLSGSAIAHAVPVHYSIETGDPGVLNPGNRGEKAGKITAINTSYNAVSGEFFWSYDIADTASGTPNNDAFWLVVSDGPNPKNSSAGQLAILYGDFTSGSNTLSAYQYNGKNNNVSYNDPGVLVEQWTDNRIMVDRTPGENSQTVSFSINVDSLNSHVPSGQTASGSDWEGIGFGSKIGVWFHPSAGSTITYANSADSSGLIQSYGYSHQSWEDSNNKTTTVPEPTGLALLAAGAIGLGLARRKMRVVES